MIRIFLCLSCLSLAFGAAAQSSIGMIIGNYYNNGKGFNWGDVAGVYSTSAAADSAMKSSVQNSSFTAMVTSTIGANFRIKPTDSSRFLYKWSQNYSVAVGSLKTRGMLAKDLYRYNVNTPYTTIYKGDTTVYSLDSIKYFQHELTEDGAFGQFGFALMRELATAKRMKGEVGFQLSVGIGKTTSYYTRAYNFTEIDSAAAFTSPNGYFILSENVPIGTQTIATASLGLTGGLIIPLAKEDDTWWLSIHATLGMGAMYAYEKWAGRISFASAFGINYRFQSRTAANGYR